MPTPSLRLLAHFRQTTLPPLLCGLGTRFSVQQVIPPPKTARVVANEALMMDIMMLCTCPEWQEVMQAPWKLVAAMGINGLEQTTHNPEVHSENVQVARDGAPKDRCAHSPKAENHDFNWGGVFSGHAEWSGVLVVYLMNVFVQWTPVQRSVRPVVPCVFQNEKDSDLIYHCEDGGKRNASRKTNVYGHGVEEPRKFSGLSSLLHDGTHQICGSSTVK